MSEAAAPRATYAAGSMATFVMFAYACTLALTMLHLPPQRLDAPTSIFLASIGLLALWRYSWWGLHVIRAIRFRKTVFPGYRHAADRLAPSVRPEHVYVLITSYRVAPETTFKVYDALVKNAIDYGQPTTIIASITDQTDVDVLSHVLAANGHPDQVRVRFMFQRATRNRGCVPLPFCVKVPPAMSAPFHTVRDRTSSLRPEPSGAKRVPSQVATLLVMRPPADVNAPPATSIPFHWIRSLTMVNPAPPAIPPPKFSHWPCRCRRR